MGAMEWRLQRRKGKEEEGGRGGKINRNRWRSDGTPLELQILDSILMEDRRPGPSRDHPSTGTAPQMANPGQRESGLATHSSEWIRRRDERSC